MNKDDNIKGFVIDKLGCNCPLEVFNIINWQKDVRIDENIVLDYKLNIGNRLLIYIIGIEDIIILNEIFAKLIRIGINERDNNNFNRFRLVTISDNIAKIGSIAHNLFNNLDIDDQKVHLHVILKTDFVL